MCRGAGIVCGQDVSQPGVVKLLPANYLEKERAKERETEREKDRQKNRERERGIDREGDTSRAKDRDVYKDSLSDKDRDRDRDRDRERDREREWDRDRDRDRERDRARGTSLLSGGKSGKDRDDGLPFFSFFSPSSSLRDSLDRRLSGGKDLERLSGRKDGKDGDYHARDNKDRTAPLSSDMSYEYFLAIFPFI